MSDGFEWRDAAVTYPDWVGTAQLDQRMTAAGIEEVVGLDPDVWTVVGIDIGGGEDGRHDLRVVAASRADLPDGGDVLRRAAAANGGELPVTEFLIHDRDPYAVLKAITHVFELRLRIRSTQGVTLRVTKQSDVSEQDS